MDRFIANQNIKRFRKELESGCDPRRRELLVKLIAAEQRHLAQAEADQKPEAPRRSSIAQLIEQFRREPDPLRRNAIRRRLIDEEDQFGVLSQQIDLVDTFIKEGQERIEKLEALMARRIADASSGLDTMILSNCRDILGTLTSHRALLEERARRRGV